MTVGKCREPKPGVKVDKFLATLKRAAKEEAVIASYAKLLGAAEWDRPFSTDGLHQGTLFEFKFDYGSPVVPLAQLCAYLRMFHTHGVYKGVVYPMPLRVAACDRDEAVVVAASDLEKYYTGAYDWSRPASNPDPALVADLGRDFKVSVFQMDTEPGVKAFLAALAGTGSPMSQVITRDNFADVFAAWKSAFAGDLGPQDAALAFLHALQARAHVNDLEGSVLLGDAKKGQCIELSVPVEAWRRFWSAFKLPPSNAELDAILSRKDRLVAIQHRRETGEFFTPPDVAALAHTYLFKAVPDAYEAWNWWDMCCGSGNLTLDCPSMPGRLFMSTLHQQDVDAVHAAGQNPEACVFAYDFLNQPDEELPAALREKLVPGSKWVFLFNPPFAAGTDLNAAFGDSGAKHKTGVSDTVVGDAMESLGLRHACQNTYCQFMHRVTELVTKYKLKAVMGVFSKAMFATGTGYSGLREQFSRVWRSELAVLWYCGEFSGATGAWPVLFSVWRSL